MTDTIKRWECPECGRNTATYAHTPTTEADWCRFIDGGPATCPGVPVERTYVAVDSMAWDDDNGHNSMRRLIGPWKEKP